MAGNKNSGRKLYRDREREQMAYHKSLMIILRYLSDKEVPLKDKAAMAKDIFMKTLPVAQDAPVTAPTDLAKDALKEQLEFLDGIKV